MAVPCGAKGQDSTSVHHEWGIVADCGDARVNRHRTNTREVPMHGLIAFLVAMLSRWPGRASWIVGSARTALSTRLHWSPLGDHGGWRSTPFLLGRPGPLEPRFSKGRSSPVWLWRWQYALAPKLAVPPCAIRRQRGRD